MGWELLTEQIVDRVRAEVEASRSSASGDSEIERLLLHALSATIRLGMAHHGSLVELSDETRHLYISGSHCFFYERQVQIENWRVDFLFQAWNHDQHRGSKNWQKLIVECDGHNFHERTKEQAARDRARDRWAIQNGFDIFRFTGSEIWRDPLGCVEQVNEWAARYWG